MFGLAEPTVSPAQAFTSGVVSDVSNPEVPEEHKSRIFSVVPVPSKSSMPSMFSKASSFNLKRRFRRSSPKVQDMLNILASPAAALPNDPSKPGISENT